MISPAPSQNSAPLHLVAPPSSRTNTKHFGRTVPCLLLSSHLADSSQSQQLTQPQIVIVGDASTRTTATQFDIPFTHHIAPLLSNQRYASRQLISRVSALPTPPTRIICWSDELLPLASAAASRFGLPLELVSTNPSVLNKVTANIDSIKAFDESDHDFWTNHRHTSSTDHCLAQRIDSTPPSAASRNAAKANLNIDDSTLVLAAVADAPNQVDAREFAFLLGLLSVSGYQILGLIPKSAKNLEQALRHHRGLDQPFRLLTTTDPLPALLPLIDAYIHPTDTTNGSTKLLDRYMTKAQVPILNLRHSGKAGFSRAQGTAGQLLDEVDQVINNMQNRNASQPDGSQSIAAQPITS